MTTQACIIGGGVIGCSVAYELRKRGLEVTVVDRNGDVGHGSTSASCGIVRRFYSQPGMTAMAHEGAQVWADWGGYLGPVDEDLAVFKRPGMAFLLTEIDDDVRERVAGLKEVGVPCQLLTTEELEERFPYLDVVSQHPPKSIDDPAFLDPGPATAIGGAVFEEDSGYVVSPGLATHNLWLAGDWVRTGFSCGCIEATALSGLQCAAALSGQTVRIDGLWEQPGAPVTPDIVHAESLLEAAQ